MNITGKNLTDQGWQIEPRFRHSPPVWHKGNLRYNAGRVWINGLEDEAVDVFDMEDIEQAEKELQ